MGMVNENEELTWENPEMDEPERLPEHDMIEMTKDLYREMFNGPEPPKDRWFFVFTRKKRTQVQFWMTSYMVNMCRMLADEYKGSVRFAYINTTKEKNLKETFDTLVLPNGFFYSNGTFYEQNNN